MTNAYMIESQNNTVWRETLEISIPTRDDTVRYSCFEVTLLISAFNISSSKKDKFPLAGLSNIATYTKSWKGKASVRSTRFSSRIQFLRHLFTGVGKK